MTTIAIHELSGGPAAGNDFMALLPAVRRHAQIRFRHLGLPDREEAVAESVAAAFVNFHQLSQKQKLAQAHVSTLAQYATRHTAQDRHVGGSQSSTDLLSSLARKRRGYALSCLPDEAGDSAAGWRLLASQDPRVSPADQAAFRLDFQVWLRTRSRRERKIVNQLASGESTSAVAGRFGLSPGRISQLRRKLERSWQQLQGESGPAFTSTQ